MKKFTIGVDFGTLSARAVLIDGADGSECAAAEFVYPHGVMNEADVCGGTPSPLTALQHPADYEQALSLLLPQVIKRGGVQPEQIAAIGIDFTSCTVFPVYADGTPLCYDKQFECNPHAYAKLWKHHGADDCAADMTRVALQRGEAWLDDYGGTLSSEELLPKALEVYRRAPEVYAKTAYFVEGADWLIWKLTGKLTRSACFVGFKALWDGRRGYPKEYLAAVEPAFSDFFETKLQGEVLPTGSLAGYVSKQAADAYGLSTQTAVAVPVIDAHAAMPAAGVTEEGKLLLILGTSGVQLILDKNDRPVKGICGKVGGGVVPGYYVYEAGQTGVGDAFDWFIRSCVPGACYDEAKRRGLSVYDYLNELCEEGEGAGGVVAVDWWNGNRNPYNDAALCGVMTGLTLQTKPQHMYYAMLSSVAFGTRKIVQLLEEGGVTVGEAVAAGGIAGKNPLFMQIMANVLNMPITVVDSKQAGAKGSAVFAAAAGGLYEDLQQAAAAMADKPTRRYYPRPQEVERMHTEYARYCRICEFFANEYK